MLTLTTSSLPSTFPISTSSSPHRPLLINHPKFTLRPHTTKVLLRAENKNRNGPNNNSPDDEKRETNERPRLNLKWVDLLLDPDPDNVVAVGLTGVLAWAGVQVLWQLLFISLAILVAALKYSFIAALLIFILITLL